MRTTKKKKFNCITESGGAAGEYSRYSLNFFRSCSNRCSYCYGWKHYKPKKGEEEAAREKYFNEIVPKKEYSLENLEKGLKKLVAWLEAKPADSEDRIHLSFLGDPYNPEAEGITRPALELIRQYGVSWQILSKEGLRAAADFDLYSMLLFTTGSRYGATLTLDNIQDTEKEEPGTASPDERIETLREAHERGIETWASIEPVLDPDQSLTMIERAAPYTGDFHVGKLNHWPERERLIDWRDFKRRAEELLNGLEKPYRIKDDLVKAARV